MSGSGRPLITVDATNNLQLAPELNTFIGVLNPLGTIAQTIVYVVAIEAEIKRLKAEREEARLHYDNQLRMIEATERYALKTLDTRRDAVNRYFDYAEAQLAEHSFTTSEIAAALQEVRSQVNEADTSKLMFLMQAISDLSRCLVELAAQGSTNLTALIEATRTDLHGLPPVSGLLPSGQ